MEGRSVSEIPPEEGAIQHLLNTEVDEIDPHNRKFGALTWTSIEMLDTLLATGRLPDRSEEADYNSEETLGIALPGLVAEGHSFPQNDEVRKFLSNPDQAAFYAKVEANRVAEIHYFLRTFGLPFDNPPLTRVVSDYLHLSDRGIQDLMTRESGSEEYAAEQNIVASMDLLSFLPSEAMDKVPIVANDAKSRKGIVIGISTPPKAAEFRILGPIAGNDHLMKFSFGPRGMHYTNIGANSPQGRVEKAYYSSLRNGNKPPTGS